MIKIPNILQLKRPTKIKSNGSSFDQSLKCVIWIKRAKGKLAEANRRKEAFLLKSTAEINYNILCLGFSIWYDACPGLISPWSRLNEQKQDMTRKDAIFKRSDTYNS